MAAQRHRSFILARLEAAGLQRLRPADRPTLIRRLSLDLIGLPPTPEEADASSRPSADAYEKLVDRLLASPHYGERWARRWLDLARYADTNGYEKDRPRSIWPYRDWVIKALNADLPFDRFTIEQLAGDLLPGATPAQRIATGFHRNTMLNEEGGIDPLEFRFYAMTDRVATTATVWLGLTLGCAQCHTHKYDPITQSEYYQFLAFLNNTDEPEIAVPDAGRRPPPAHEIEAKIAALEADLPDQFPVDPDDEVDADPPRAGKDTSSAGSATGSRREAAAPWPGRRSSRPRRRANLPLLTIEDDGSVFASGDQTKCDTYRCDLPTGRSGITAFRLDALPDDRLPDGGPGRTYYEGPMGDFFLSELRSRRWPARTLPLEATASSASAEGAAAARPSTAISRPAGRSTAARAKRTRPCSAGRAARRRPRPGSSEMVFERLLRRRAGPVPARGRRPTRGRSSPATLPADVERLSPGRRRTARTPEQQDRLLRQFLGPRRAGGGARGDRRSSASSVPDVSRPRWSWPNGRRRIPGPRSCTAAASSSSPTSRVEPAVLVVLPPLPQDAPRNRLGSARAGSSIAAIRWRPGDGQPAVGGALRPGVVPRRRLRLPGRAAQPSRAARLARRRVHGARLVDRSDCTG